MPIFGAVLGFMAGVTLGGIIGTVLVTMMQSSVGIFGSILVLGLGIYGAWIGYRMLPI